MLRAAAPLALLAFAAPAWALTPEALWEAWQAQAAGLGVTLSAEAVPGPGGTLTLRNWTVAVRGGAPEALPPDAPVQEVSLRPEAGEAVLIDLGLPERIDIPASDSVGADVRLETAGLAIRARDAASGAIAYEARTDRLTAVTLPPVDGTGAGLAEVAAEVTGLALGASGGIGAGEELELTLAMEGLAFVTDTGPAEAFGSRQASRTEGRQEMALTLTWPAGSGLVAMGEVMAAVSDAAAGQALVGFVADGLGIAATYASGPVTQQTWVEGFPFAYSYSSDLRPSTGEMRLDRAGVALTAAAEGGTGTVTLPMTDLPAIDLGFGLTDVDLRMPLGPEGGEWRYRVGLEDLTVGEAAWAALDPQGLLPRTPARLAVDLGGRMTLDLAGVMAAEAAGPGGGKTPAVPEIESLELREMALSFAGVEASAGGSFVFDNASGIPVPAGAAYARVEGLDRLIDAAVSMGWITAEDARNARLGLAVAFRAGDGPDVRETAIDARPDGSVFVNGVQMQ